MDLITWLLEGDVSIQYQTHRDLLGKEKFYLKDRIQKEGFGLKLLNLQKEGYYWGQHYYLPKWISTHYTLLELRRLEINLVPNIKSSIDYILDTFITDDGGISPNPKSWKFSDVCLNGMNLFSFCYFKTEEEKLKSIIDFILTQQLADGGFNCYHNDPRYNPNHSSLHSTVSLIEGMNEYLLNDYQYKRTEIIESRKKALEFILMHQLYLSDRTGEIINSKFIMLSYPPRWKYDILRAFEAFRNAGLLYDKRMDKAFDVLIRKRKKDGTWPLQNKHQGQVHFDMEKPGKSSRWNTLRALRVLKHFKPDIYENIIEEK